MDDKFYCTSSRISIIRCISDGHPVISILKRSVSWTPPIIILSRLVVKTFSILRQPFCSVLICQFHLQTGIIKHFPYYIGQFRRRLNQFNSSYIFLVLKYLNCIATAAIINTVNIKCCSNINVCLRVQVLPRHPELSVRIDLNVNVLASRRRPCNGPWRHAGFPPYRCLSLISLTPHAIRVRAFTDFHGFYGV